MQNLLWVGFGGFLGAIGRYQLSGWVAGWTGGAKFPWGTAVVNVLGCLAVGLLAGAAERLAVWGPEVRLFLFAGLLGGFTTFSAFGLETVALLRRGDSLAAALYALGSVAFGLAAVGLGLKLVALVPR